MASAFRRTCGRYVAGFDPDELTVVVMLLEQTRELLVGSVPGVPPGTRSGTPAVGTPDSDSDADADADVDADVDVDVEGADGGGDGESQSDAEFAHLMRSAGWGEDGTPPAEPPQPRASAVEPPLPPDPALRRLLPDPNPTDPQASAEFRRLTGSGLRERKAATIGAAIDSLTAALTAAPSAHGGTESRPRGEGGRRRRRPAQVTVDLDQAQAQALIVALTDVRLVLGERLELTTEDDADEVLDRLEHSLDPADPLVALAFAYDFLTWLQESLSQALLG